MKRKKIENRKPSRIWPLASSLRPTATKPNQSNLYLFCCVLFHFAFALFRRLLWCSLILAIVCMYVRTYVLLNVAGGKCKPWTEISVGWLAQKKKSNQTTLPCNYTSHSSIIQSALNKTVLNQIFWKRFYFWQEYVYVVFACQAST